MILEGLTDGLPIKLRQLLTISPPSNPTEWIITVTKLLKIQNSEQNDIENLDILDHISLPQAGFLTKLPEHLTVQKYTFRVIYHLTRVDFANARGFKMPIIGIMPIRLSAIQVNPSNIYANKC
ncbi:hypothetical protein TNCT_492321 [Trichonephila clavata]|uniref:Uncharacterized protein n=1 Tax=Trichonephila clavata TaxID=2740835 RepID=A0A8X6KWS6_TRICU|nr:hypothetical protein TNCT_492321 [Trichonephila clavata]